MAKAATLFYGPAQVATGPTTVYTVPASSTAVLRHIHVQNPSASAVTLTISIGADAAGTRVLATQTIPAQVAGTTGNVVDWYWYIPVAAGVIVTLSAGTNNILVITIAGDLLTVG